VIEAKPKVEEVPKKAEELGKVDAKPPVIVELKPLTDPVEIVLKYIYNNQVRHKAVIKLSRTLI
jgi:hypothetical protein